MKGTKLSSDHGEQTIVIEITVEQAYDLANFLSKTVVFSSGETIPNSFGPKIGKLASELYRASLVYMD